MEQAQVPADILRERLAAVGDFWIHIEADSTLEKYPAKQHAQRVVEKLGVTEGLIYLPGCPTYFWEDSDQPRAFHQRRYFYYLTGSNEADQHVTYDIQNDELTLYIPKNTVKKSIWSGRTSTIEEAREKYDMDEVLYNNTLIDYIRDWPLHNDGQIYVLHPSQAPDSGLIPRQRVDLRLLQRAMDAARVIKDEHEIKLIRKANDVSAAAHAAVLANISNFKNEAEVAGLFVNTCMSKGAPKVAYRIIAASGPNAAVLHYDQNNEPFGDRHLMVLDAGAEWNCYASDVTRTIPLSGRWPTKECKEIYDLVQKMQDAAASLLAPGVRYFDSHRLAHQIAVDGLLELGILHNGTREEILKAGTSLAFFPHGIGHHVGLEVHDVSATPIMQHSNQWKAPSAEISELDLAIYQKEMCRAPVHPASGGLEEGMVITVEPGIYFSDLALKSNYLSSPVHSKFINTEVLAKYMSVGGVRIEDNYLITSSGYENITTAPKGEAMLSLMRGEKSLATSTLKESNKTTPLPTTILTDRAKASQEQEQQHPMRHQITSLTCCAVQPEPPRECISLPDSSVLHPRRSQTLPSARAHPLSAEPNKLSMRYPPNAIMSNPFHMPTKNNDMNQLVDTSFNNYLNESFGTDWAQEYLGRALPKPRPVSMYAYAEPSYLQRLDEERSAFEDELEWAPGPSLYENFSKPQVPPKLPELPEKPLAYRPSKNDLPRNTESSIRSDTSNLKEHVQDEARIAISEGAMFPHMDDQSHRVRWQEPSVVPCVLESLPPPNTFSSLRNFPAEPIKPMDSYAHWSRDANTRQMIQRRYQQTFLKRQLRATRSMYDVRHHGNVERDLGQGVANNSAFSMRPPQHSPTNPFTAYNPSPEPVSHGINYVKALRRPRSEMFRSRPPVPNIPSTTASQPYEMRSNNPFRSRPSNMSSANDIPSLATTYRPRSMISTEASSRIPPHPSQVNSHVSSVPHFRDERRTVTSTRDFLRNPFPSSGPGILPFNLVDLQVTPNESSTNSVHV